MIEAIIGVLQAVVLLAYPLAVYFGLSHFNARGVGLLVLVLLAPGLLRTVVRRRKQVAAMIGLPIAVACLMLCAVVSNDPRFVLANPALVNLILLSQFGFSLRKGSSSMVERFARLQVDDLPANEIAYCRVVTACWCVFFVLNGGACALFALWAPRAWWALYTGLVSYVILGVLFAIEFTIRKYLFRRYGVDGFLDKLYALVFPPRPVAPPAREQAGSDVAVPPSGSL